MPHWRPTSFLLEILVVCLFNQKYHLFQLRGHLPLYLPLIICKCILNTIMHIMNFINAMLCTYVCLHSVLHILDVCFSRFWLHSLQSLHAHLWQACSSPYVLSFVFLSRRSVGETWLKFLLWTFSSFILRYLASWKLKHAEHKEGTCILCAANDKIASVLAQIVAHPTASFCFQT